MTGDYILSIASIMISRLRNDDVTIVLSQVSFFFPYLFIYIFFIKLFLFCLVLFQRAFIFGVVTLWEIPKRVVGLHVQFISNLNQQFHVILI